MSNTKGPLAGVRMVEFAGIGPGPFAGMMFSDMGAEVLRVARRGAGDAPPEQIDARGRRTITLDLKQADAVAFCLEICDRAEVVFEGNRPGVMERLGLGPETMLARNPRLVYGRMTGWGQSGPLAEAAGHDINYLALSGALHAIGPAEKPFPPLNLVADYGGGGMFLVCGILAALLHARANGQGQVVDAAMTDGAAYLMALIYGLLAAGQWSDSRGANLLDGAAPFYNTYQCSDGKWIAVGAIEPQFYALLLQKSGVIGIDPTRQMDRRSWPETRAAFAALFASRSRGEWCAIMENTDACFAPVLSLGEAPDHPHNRARGTFTESGGVVQPAPAPRFSATSSAIQHPPRPAGAGVAETLERWGLPEARFARFLVPGDVAPA